MLEINPRDSQCGSESCSSFAFFSELVLQQPRLFQRCAGRPRKFEAVDPAKAKLEALSLWAYTQGCSSAIPRKPGSTQFSYSCPHIRPFRRTHIVMIEWLPLRQTFR